MPYQLRFPSVEEIVDWAVSKYGAQLKTTTVIRKSDGKPEPVNYLERIVDGRVYQATLPKQQMVFRNELRSIAARLGIPDDEFNDRFDSPMEKYFDDFGGLIDPDEPQKN